MLSPLDETLFHQGPDPFVTVGTADHRFFDRYWFSGISPDGDVAFFAGTGRYANLATRDAFLNLLIGTTQHNVRVAQEIDVVLDAGAGAQRAAVGGFGVEVDVPFRRLRLSMLDERSTVRCDLVFETSWPPHLEARHREMAGHRLAQEQTRYDQVGAWTGWLEVDGRRIVVDGWWGDRDHSWGLRVDVGGIEPPSMVRRVGSFMLWCNFSTDQECGLVHVREYDDLRPSYLDGSITRHGETLRVVDVRQDVEQDEVGWARARFDVTVSNGSTAAFEAEPLTLRPWCSRGGGYSRGFEDRRGFGARRGDVIEQDVYDLIDPRIVLCDGHEVQPGHREQIATLLVDGERRGTAHLPIMRRSGDLVTT
jgi:hypothetical protein